MRHPALHPFNHTRLEEIMLRLQCRRVPAPRPRTITLTLAGLLLVSPAAPLSAQIGFESLFSGITDISVSFTCWNTRSAFLREEESCPSRKAGYGVEVLWNLRSIPVGPKPKIRSDTTWTLTEKEESYRGAQVDSIRRYAVKVEPGTDPRPSVLIEVGLGYSQFSGFESSDPEFEIRGSVREIPAVTLYGTLIRDGKLGWIKPYVGVRTGLIQLHNVQLYDSIAADSVVVFSGSAQTFQIGGAIGVALGDGPLHAFAEAAYHFRRFPSVQWGAAGANRLPDTLPRGFDFSGPSVSIGVQVGIRERQ
jgi:hypothetical protein